MDDIKYKILEIERKIDSHYERSILQSDSQGERIDKLGDKLDNFSERLHELAIISSRQMVLMEQQEKIMEQNTESLKEHMKRTALLEEEMNSQKIEKKTIMKVLVGVGTFIGFIGLSGLAAIIKTLLGL